jgi:hypothetical protein
MATNAVQPANAEFLRESLFDTLIFGQGAVLPPTISFFQSNTETNAPHLTNLTQPRQLPGDQQMSVYSIRLGFLATADADILGIMQKYSVRLVVQGKSRFRGPIIFCPAGGGPVAANQNGDQSYQAVLVFPDAAGMDLSIDIAGGVNFSLDLVGLTGYTLQDETLGAFIIGALDGIHQVPTV